MTNLTLTFESSELSATWTPPVTGRWSGYQMRYRSVLHVNSSQFLARTLPPAMTSINITGLFPGERYHLVLVVLSNQLESRVQEANVTMSESLLPSVSFCYNEWVLVTVCEFLLLCVSSCYHLWVFVTICEFLLLFLSSCYYLWVLVNVVSSYYYLWVSIKMLVLQFVTSHFYVWVLGTKYEFLLLCVSLCYYMSVLATMCVFLSLFEF